MSKKDSGHVTEQKLGSNINKNLLWVGGLIFLIVLANKEPASNEASEKPAASTGHISSSACISKIHNTTQYDRSRLKLSRQTESAVHVSYRNDFGRVHKFRCQGQSGTVQLFAEGAGMWMAM